MREFVCLQFDLDMLNVSYDIDIIDISRYLQGFKVFLHARFPWYLAVVLYLTSRKIAGWAMSNRLKAPLFKEALSMANWRRKPEKVLIHHSDRGSQYAGSEYQKLLEQYSMICSMRRKGDCWIMPWWKVYFTPLKPNGSLISIIEPGTMPGVT